MKSAVFAVNLLVAAVAASPVVWADHPPSFIVRGSVDVTEHDGVTLRDGFPDDLLSGGLNASGLQGPAPRRRGGGSYSVAVGLSGKSCFENVEYTRSGRLRWMFVGSARFYRSAPTCLDSTVYGALRRSSVPGSLLSVGCKTAPGLS